MIVSERRQGRFTRQLFLGDSLDADRVEASYDRGVLTLTVPVTEQAKPRKVQVLTSSESQPIEAERAQPEQRRGDGHQLVLTDRQPPERRTP